MKLKTNESNLKPAEDVNRWLSVGNSLTKGLYLTVLVGIFGANFENRSFTPSRKIAWVESEGYKPSFPDKVRTKNKIDMTIFAKRKELIDRIMKIMKNHDFQKNGAKNMCLNIMIEIKRYELTFEELPEIRLCWLFHDLEKALMPTPSQMEDEAEKVDSEMARRNPRKRRQMNKSYAEMADGNETINMDCTICSKKQCDNSYQCMKKLWIITTRDESEKRKLKQDHEELMDLLQDF